MTVEKIKDDNNNSIEVFKNDIELYISLFCEENNIDINDVCNMSQNRFNAILYYLYQHIFKNADLKNSNIYTNSWSYKTNCNSYNIPLLEKICDIYIYYCDMYDKIANVQGFCRMTGIDSETVYDWDRTDGRKKASGQSSEILKKLTRERERSLSDRLVSGKGNPVGILGALNHWHNWAGVGNMTEKKPDAVTLQDVRKRAALLSDNSPQVVADSEPETVLELSDNLTQLEKP